MAAGDKLWFELGVRDEISHVLENLMRNSEKLANLLSDDSAELKNIYRNITDIAGVYDKIYVAQKRISELKSTSLSSDEKKGLNEMSKSLENVRKEFEGMIKDPDRLLNKGEATFEKLRTNIELMVKSTLRYVDGIEAKEKAEAINAANEERRIDSLKAKYYELQRQRKDLSDAIANAAPGSSTSNAVSLLNSITGKMGAVSNAQRRGTGMPASLVGADAEEFSRKVKAEIAGLTSATNDYNKALEVNHRLQKQLEKIYLDSQSQQQIAYIRNQRAEYTALGQKMNEIGRLMGELSRDRSSIIGGNAAALTQEMVAERLDAINRRYNETLAQGREQEKQSAKSKQQLADADKKAAEAARNHANANRSLSESYNRVTEAGNNTNRILEQFKNQISYFVSLYGLERLLKSIIQIGGEFEVQHIALQSILGDVQQANSMFEQMKELAVVSPFNFRQLATYSKQIAAFGIPYEEMYDTTKRLADMSAGLGVDMGRLILAYGQVRSAAVLRGQELRQFTEAGIPMVQALAQEFTKLNGRAVSTAEVFELISKRAVPFEMVKKVMWDMTNEGGRFFDMQFTLSDTLAGKWSNLQDAWEIMLSEFAKGESLSGQFLKSVVTLLTKLTETANTLMPLLAGGGLFYLTKKAENSIAGMGLRGIDANIKKAQQLQAIELRRKLINQEITREQYNIGMAMNKSQARYYVMLANEGQLKNYQIQRLLNQNKINNARLHELVASKELTMREAAQIRLWRMKNGEISAFQMRMNNLWSGAKSFMKANAWMIAIDVAITALTTWYAKAKETEAKNAELVNSFSNSAKEIKEAYNSLNDDRLTNDDDYKNGIAGLKEQVKQHSANYEAIIREANSLETLQEQYKYLKNALYEESVVAQDAEQKAEKFGDSTREAFEEANKAARYITTGRQSFWDVIFGADTDVQRGLNKRIKELYQKILEVVPDVGKNEHSNELYRKLRNSMEEQLGFGSKEKMLINIRLNELFHIDNIEDATTLVVDKFSEMLSKAEPQIANKIRYGQALNQAEKDKVAELVNEATEETKSRYPYYANTLQKLLNDSNFIANIQLRFSTMGKKANDFQKWIYGNMAPYLDESIKNIATSWGESGSSFDAQNAAKRDIDAAKNELESRKRQTKLSQKNLDEAKKQKKNQDEIDRLQKQRDDAGKRESEAKTLYENRKTAALQGLGYDYEGELKKSNKEKNTPKGKDAELEQAKTRLDFIKKFYAEYKKYREQFGPEKGQSMVDEIFGMKKGEGDKIVKDYDNTIRSVLDGLELNTDDRKKFATMVRQLLGEINLDDVKEKAKKVADVIKEEIQRQGEQWNLYEQLFKKTGNRGFAFEAFKDGKIWDEQSLSLAESLKKNMESNLKSDGRIIIDWDAEERTAEDYFKENFNNGTALYELWLSIVKLIRGNYTDALKESADAIASSMTYAQRTASVMAEYEKKIREARKIENNDAAIYALEKERDAKLANIQAEQLRDDINWDAVFGNIENYTKKVLVKTRKIIKDWINLNRNKADVKTIKDMTEAVNKLDDAIQKKGGLFGGIKDAVVQLRKAEKELTAAKLDYESAVSNYGANSIQAQEAKQRLNQKQKGVDDAEKNVRAERDATLNKITTLANTMASLGKSGKMSLTEIGNVAGNLISALSSTNTAIGQLIAAILAILDSIGQQGFDVFLGNILDSVAHAIGGIFKGVANIWGTFIGMPNAGDFWDEWFGDGYAEYNKVKAEYESLVAVWDSLISKKEKYMDIRWGVEAQKAADEVRRLMKQEVEYARYAASERLGAGASMGSHSQGYRMWNNDGWKQAAGEISNALGGVNFKGMNDMTKMTAEQLQWIKENYYGLWAQMDQDFKEYLEKIIEYGDKAKDIIEDLKEKLTGWRLDTVKKEWADLLSTMDNGVDKLSENLEEKLKNAILNSMVDNLFTKRLQALIDSVGQNDSYIDKSGKVRQHSYDENGNITDTDVASEFTQDEYELMMNEGKSIAEDMTAVRDMLKGIYGWTDEQSSSSSSSSSNTIKGVTEQTADLIASYVNAIRADVSVNRVTLNQILVAVQGTANLPVIAQSQLDQLRTLVQLARMRTDFVSEIRDILHRASDGGNYIRIR